MAYSGRKRVYAPSGMGPSYKRRKYSSKYRRPAYRRRFRSRRNGGGRDAVMTTNGLRGGGLRFNSRRVPYSRYKKKLWDDGLTSQHFRSVKTTVTTLGTPTN